MCITISEAAYSRAMPDWEAEFLTTLSPKILNFIDKAEEEVWKGFFIDSQFRKQAEDAFLSYTIPEDTFLE